MTRPLALLSLLLFLLCPPPTSSHASCCKKHLLPFIPDESAVAPATYLGEARLIPHPDPAVSGQPAFWDEDDDGAWEAPLVENPRYAWVRPVVRNPGYKPPGLLERFTTEVTKAVPWVVIGVLFTVLLDTLALPVGALRRVLQRAGPFQGALIGLATPLCSCGALPVAAITPPSRIGLRTSSAGQTPALT